MSIADKQDYSEIRSSVEDHEERINTLEKWRDTIVQPLCDELKKLTSAIKGDDYGNPGLINTVKDFEKKVMHVDGRLGKIDHLKWWVMGAVAASGVLVSAVWAIFVDGSKLGAFFH